MKKIGGFVFFITLISLSFVSAQYYYGGSSFGSILSSVDESTIVLGVIFVVSALVINVALSRSNTFTYHKNVAGVIAISIALLIVYYINKTSWNYYGFFNGVFFFVPTEFLETLWPILLFIGVLFFLFRFKWEALLWGGLILILLGFIFPEGSILISIGIGMIVLRLLLYFIGIRSNNGYSYSGVPGTVGRGLWGGTKWMGRKSADLGREWTRRDQEMRKKIEVARAHEMALGEDAERQRKAEMDRLHGEALKEDRAWRAQKAQIDKDHEAALKEYAEREAAAKKGKRKGFLGWD